MASNLSPCGLCRTLDHSSPSTSWCLQCRQGLGADREKRHKACSGTDSHPIAPIEKYRQLSADVLKISQTCPEHNEPYQAYCDVHECVCCFKCTLKEHKKCENLVPIDDAVKGVKYSNALRECETNLEENKENIGIIIKDRQQNISRLSEEKTKIQKEIKQTRKTVNEHLDKLEAQLLQELTKLEKVHTTKFQTIISSLDKKQREIEEMRRNLNALKEHASEIQIFLSMKKMEKRSFSDNKYIEKLCSSKVLNTVSITMVLDKILENIEKSVTTFGSLSKKSSPSHIALQKRRDKQAQLHVPSGSPIECIGEVAVEIDWLNGCCVLPDGRFAVTSNDFDSAIFMIEDGTIDCEISTLPYDVRDITHIPSTNTLAVTTGAHRLRRINIVDLDTKTIKWSISSETDNFGIMYRDQHLFYCAAGVGICKMSMDDNKVTKIKTMPDMSTVSYIASHQDKLYYTNREAHTVTCCSLDGTTMWEFRDKKVLREPQGLCVNNQGFVYVVGCKSNNLVVISPDGNRHSKLLTDKDGLDKPFAVDYDQTTNRLLVINLMGKMFIYNEN